MTPRLLILACSATKRLDPLPLPALDRYDGPTFRVLRKYLRTLPDTTLDVWVLSGKYGLIASHDQVDLYDSQMTPERAGAFRPAVEPLVESLALGRSTCIVMGRTYSLALGGAAPAALRLEGGLGTCTAGLRRWLYGCVTPSAIGLPARFKLLDRLSSIEAERLACERGLGNPAAVRLGAYAALVGGARVSPKWLVAELSGLPVSSFRTADALRFLAHIGVTVVPV